MNFDRDDIKVLINENLLNGIDDYIKTQILLNAYKPDVAAKQHQPWKLLIEGFIDSQRAEEGMQLKRKRNNFGHDGPEAENAPTNVRQSAVQLDHAHSMSSLEGGYDQMTPQSKMNLEKNNEALELFDEKGEIFGEDTEKEFSKPKEISFGITDEIVINDAKNPVRSITSKAKVTKDNNQKLDGEAQTLNNTDILSKDVDLFEET